MSAALLGLAFRCSMGSHVAKLVLLKLVDAAEDDGTRVYPAVATIARAAQAHERTVQRILRLFVARGLLRLVRQGGGGPGDTSEYALDLDMMDRIQRHGWPAASGDVAATADGADGDESVTESPPTGFAGPPSPDGEGLPGADADMPSPDPDKGGVVPPFDAGKGGAMTPPFERVAKGGIESAKGGIESAKGGVSCHPTPPLDPSFRPLPGRESARATGAGQAGDAEAASIEAEFRRLVAGYPDGAVDDHYRGSVLFARLTLADRQAALAALPRWRDYLARQRRRPPVHEYLDGRRWELLAGGGAPAKAAAAGRALVQPWTRAWWRLYLDHCEVNRSLVGDPRSAASSLLRRHVSAARNRLPWDAGTGFDLAGLEERARHLVQVAIGSDTWRRWQTHWRARYGVDLPGPDAAPFAFLPAAEPPDDAPGLGLSTDDDVARLAGA